MKAAIYNYQTWIAETNPDELVNCLEACMKAANFNVLNYMSHHFSPHGFTAIWLLEESHLAVHTFPEENKSYVEVSSCNNLKKEQFIEKLEEYQKSRL